MTGLLAVALALQAAGAWQEAPSLPVALSNNAVAGVETAGGGAVFTFGGLEAGKTWRDVTDRAFRWDVGSDAWRPVASVPGPPRLAASAGTVGGRVYLFGGYTVAEDGSEATLDRVDVYDPESDTWSAGASIPVPVDDAVAGVWRDSLVILVSGWRDTANVRAVQIYDPAAEAWSRATDIPGTPVFGHTGAVARDALIYVDGVERVDPAGAAAGAGAGRPPGSPPTRYVLNRAVWRGDIDPATPERIRWTRLFDHPGPGVYRGAAAAVGARVVFVGGSERPYNYDAVGYDGQPSRPNGLATSFDVEAGVWRSVPAPPPTMDHRALARAGGYLVLVGGMDRRGEVSDRVWMAPILGLLTGG